MKRALVAVSVVVGLVLAYVGGALGGPGEARGPQPDRQLVQSGIQSVTICEENHSHIMDHLFMKMPGVDVGLWGPEKKGKGCHVWYHYAGSEE